MPPIGLFSENKCAYVRVQSQLLGLLAQIPPVPRHYRARYYHKAAYESTDRVPYAAPQKHLTDYTLGKHISYSAPCSPANTSNPKYIQCVAKTTDLHAAGNGVQGNASDVHYLALPQHAAVADLRGSCAVGVVGCGNQRLDSEAFVTSSYCGNDVLDWTSTLPFSDRTLPMMPLPARTPVTCVTKAIMSDLT